MDDRRGVSDQRAMAIARACEQHRGARLVDVSAGDLAASAKVRDAFERSASPPPSHPSADLLSTRDDETRIIEVKGRGGSGPVVIIERQWDTLSRAGTAGWLYVVWNTTQPGPYELWLVRDPARLDWVET